MIAKKLSLSIVCFIMFLSGKTSRAAETVLATINAGAVPKSVVVNPITNRIYVVNYGDSTVSVVDGATKKVARTVNTGALPLFAAVNALTNKIYVSNQSGSVTVIDGATNLSANITVGGQPGSIAVNSVTNKVYVANVAGNSVSVIDGATNTVTSVTVGTSPSSVAINIAANTVYVANSGQNTVTVINGATNATSAVSVGANPQGIAVNPATNQAYVANKNDGTVTVIDGSDLSTQTIAVGNSPQAIAVDAISSRVYVANSADNSVSVIDPRVNTVLKTVAAGTNPQALCVNTATNKLFVANNGEHSVTVIDGALLTNGGNPLEVGQGPVALAINPILNEIYVADSGDNTLCVICGSTYGIQASVATGSGPGTVAVNPITNKIYAANAGSGNLTIIDGRTNTMQTVTTVSAPDILALNILTNRIFVGSTKNNVISVIDGASGTPTAVNLGGAPGAIAVNILTNKIYLTNPALNRVVVLDGATNAVTPVPTGASPSDVAVNPLTNRIYVTNQGDNTVTVISGTTLAVVATIQTGNSPVAVAVNPVANKIYAANYYGGSVTAIDGATNAAVSIPTGFHLPQRLFVNTITNRIYVGSSLGDGGYFVIDGRTNSTMETQHYMSGGSCGAIDICRNRAVDAYQSQVDILDCATNAYEYPPFAYSYNFASIAVNPCTSAVHFASSSNNFVVTSVPENRVYLPLTAQISALPGSVSSVANPSFTLGATDVFPDGTSTIRQIYYQIDTQAGPWISANASGGSASVTTTALSPGLHTIFAFAVDGQESAGNAPILGGMSYYPFVVTAAPTVDTTPPVLTVPADMVVDATGSTGAVVIFNVTAVDNLDGPLVPTVSPASGSLFPLGITAVKCQATDAHGNTAMKSFNVTVRPSAPPIVFTSPASADPSNALTGEIVTFSAAVSPVTAITWDFGDGTGALGTLVTHAYAQAGAYAITAAAGSARSTLSVTVAEFGDGLQPGSSKLKTVAVSLNFSGGFSSDSITIKDTILIPAGFYVAGKQIGIEAGGIFRTVTLDLAGRGSANGVSVTLKSHLKKTLVSAQNATLSVSLTGNFKAQMAALGMGNFTNKKPVFILFTIGVTAGNAIYQQTKTLRYKSTVNRSGKAM